MWGEDQDGPPIAGVQTRPGAIMRWLGNDRWAAAGQAFCCDAGRDRGGGDRCVTVELGPRIGEMESVRRPCAARSGTRDCRERRCRGIARPTRAISDVLLAGNRLRWRDRQRVVALTHGNPRTRVDQPPETVGSPGRANRRSGGAPFDELQRLGPAEVVQGDQAHAVAEVRAHPSWPSPDLRLASVLPTSSIATGISIPRDRA
jgi:hypothetical protein